MEKRHHGGGRSAAFAVHELPMRGLNGTGQSSLSRLCTSCVALIACAVPAVAQPSLRFVDIDAPARPRDGLSWQTAYKRLQNAFDDAASGNVDEIRVAGGTYTPDKGRAVDRYDRDASFALLEGLTVLGGFAGSAGPDPNERDIVRFATVLSGDLLGDDLPNFENYEDNSHTIVTAASSVAPGILDGLTIRGAGSYLETIRLPGGWIVLRDCIIRENADYAVWGEESTAEFERCTFERNRGFVHFENDDWVRFADCTITGSQEMFLSGGNFELIRCRFFDRISGEMYVYQSRLVAVECEFVGHSWRSADGGEFQFTRCRFINPEREALRVLNSFLVLSECEFVGGGTHLGRPAVKCAGGESEITDCVFRDNKSGAIVNGAGVMTVSGCLFDDNSMRPSDYGGGAIRNGGILIVDGSVFRNNTAMEDSGGAIYSDGLLTISGSSFIGNRSYGSRHSGGGAIFCEADLFLEDCVFEDNNAVRGGAIHQQSSTRRTLEATNCLFSRNTAQRSGAIGKLDGGWISLRECAFIDNAAYGPNESWAGGAIRCVARELFELWDCQFVNNRAPAGGALFLIVSESDVRRCQFIGNTAVTRAGAVFSVSERGVWLNCTFVDNQAGESGGALQLLYSGPEYRRCRFEQNSALRGGAVHSENVTGPLGFQECEFVANQADQGGALYSLQSRTSVEQCRFFDNRARALGGAVYLQGLDPRLGNSLFSGNESAVDGGAIWVAGDGAPMFRGLTVADNVAARTAGGIGLADDSRSQIGNSIFWGNRDAGGGGEAAQIARLDTAELEINYSTVQGLTGELGGVGNIGDDPAFVDSATGDYHLASGSPAIDAGDPAYAAAPDEKDIDGDPRIWNDRIDMGADEFRPLGDLNCDGAIDPMDIEPFLLALFDPQAYELGYPDCEITLADLNRDHAVDALDIEPFIRVLFP